MIEYDNGDSEELRHKTVERYIVTANTAINQLQRFTRSRLQAKTATQIQLKMAKNKQYAMPAFDEATGKMLEYRNLMKHPDPNIGKQWQRLSANEFRRTMQGVGKN
jgi:hypothetical protein